MQVNKRKPMVAANWKMNGSKALLEQMQQAFRDNQFDNADVVMCLPAPFLALHEQAVPALGAQNISQHSKGAYTGELSADILKEVAVKYVIVGHSERRDMYGEVNSIVADKVAAVIEAGMTPLFCIGESEEIRDAGKLFEFLAEQLDAVLDKVGVAGFKKLVVAYEPIWAIGTGRTATPEQAQEVHQFIRQHVAKQCEETAAGLTILYGGSVNASNADVLFGQADVDGGLVGGASLKVDEFLTICRAANQLG